MQINISAKDGVSIVTFEGAIDGKTAPEAQAKIETVLQPNSRIILDMTKVNYMSSAGLRTLLLIYRHSTNLSAKIALVGVSEEVKDVMTMTGFVKFFAMCDSLDAGIAAVNT